MTIKDLQTSKPGLARAGVIRLGYKKKSQNGKEYPVPSDHFVLTDAPGVAEALGTDKPTELRIFFPFDEIEQVFPAYHQYWVASALVCRGDGESIHYAIRPDTGEIIIRDGVALGKFSSKDPEGKEHDYQPGQHMPCPGLAHNLYGRCALCKPNAMLIVLLRDVPRLAYYQVATTSIHNIVNLTQQLTYIKQQVGRLAGVPFVLRLAPREISVPKTENGKRKGRMRTKKYLLSLEVDADWVMSLMNARRQLAAPERLALPARADVIDAEPVHRPALAQPAAPAFAEPPVWMPPNGGDDSGDFFEDDWTGFVESVLASTPFFRDEAHISAALHELGLEYQADIEQSIYDALAGYARAEADKTLASEEPQGRLM